MESIYQKVARHQAEWEELYKPIFGKRFELFGAVFEVSSCNDCGEPYFRKVIKGKTQKREFYVPGLAGEVRALVAPKN